jgi:hypothetical protein
VPPKRFEHNGRVHPSGSRIGDAKTRFVKKAYLTAFSCDLWIIITQEPAQSFAALDAPLSITYSLRACQSERSPKRITLGKLFFHRSDPTLRVGIQVRAPRGPRQWFNLT